MRFLFVSVGKAHDPEIRGAIEDFTARVNHVFNAEWLLIPGSSIEEESKKILKAVKPDDTLVLLDERGKEWASRELGEFIHSKMNDGAKRIVFVIGGAYGVDRSVREAAHITWSLSRLTFPHQIARLILAEQLYRALTIIRGEKYHHA